MAIIYHITTQKEWNDANENGIYKTASLSLEGFIHCSEETQVKSVLEKCFAGKNHLVKFAIDTNKLTSTLVYEWSLTLQEQFPHVYGPINIDAVANVETL